MNREQAAKICLVRSVEECDETAFSRDALKKALDVDGYTVGSTEWFSRRADYLFGEMPTAYKSIVHMAAFPRGALPILCGLSFILGLWANYMGPGNTIHVVFNPIVLLVVWNVLVYLAYVVLPIVTWLRSGTAASISNPAADDVHPTPAEHEPQQRDEVIPPGKKSLLLHVLVPNVWTAIHGLYASARDTTKRALCFGMVAKRFWMYWVRNAGSIVVASMRGMLHYCALFLTFGAIMGIYARGLFTEYTVVWSSTFIRSEAAALFIIKILLGPAMLCANALGWNVSEEINISAMMEQGGVLAATWIHLYVMTAIACIIIPRWLLGFWEGRRVKQAEKNIDIAIDRYFAEKIEAQVADIITHEMRAACIRVSERIAGFVCTDLYDARIVADMDAFRNRGGSISELRDTIRATCRKFEPEMTEGINRIVEDFEKALTLKIQQIIKSLHIAANADRAVCQDWTALLENGHNAIVGQSVQSIGNGVSHTIHAVLVGACAVVAGTLSGGFGEVLGLAVMTTLLGTTGPVGFLIGAVTGLVLAAGGVWMGREKMQDAIEHAPLPGWVLRTVLWQSRYEKIINEGREKTGKSVYELIYRKIAPEIPSMAQDIMFSIKKVWT